jgi:hypothetical protein
MRRFLLIQQLEYKARIPELVWLILVQARITIMVEQVAVVLQMVLQVIIATILMEF